MTEDPNKNKDLEPYTPSYFYTKFFFKAPRSEDDLVSTVNTFKLKTFKKIQDIFNI